MMATRRCESWMWEHSAFRARMDLGHGRVRADRVIRRGPEAIIARFWRLHDAAERAEQTGGTLCLADREEMAVLEREIGRRGLDAEVDR